jgi:hypothetical protein
MLSIRYGKSTLAFGVLMMMKIKKRIDSSYDLYIVNNLLITGLVVVSTVVTAVFVDFDFIFSTVIIV